MAVGVTPKWVDNLLSHHDLPGVSGGRQGRERRINEQGFLAIEIVRALSADLGIPVAGAVSMARAAMANRTAAEGRVVMPSGISVLVAFGRIELRLRDRLLGAADEVARVRRGRPRRKGPADESDR